METDICKVLCDHLVDKVLADIQTNEQDFYTAHKNASISIMDDIISFYIRQYQVMIKCSEINKGDFKDTLDWYRKLADKLIQVKDEVSHA